MMEWHWHQLDHMQIIYTSLQTDSRASTPPLSFLQAGCPSCHPVNSVKALKARTKAVETTITPQPFYGPFFRDHPGEPVPEENFWTLWCKGRLTEADTNHVAGHHSIGTNQCQPPSSPHFFTGRMPFLPPNQQCQNTEGLKAVENAKKEHSC